MARSAAPAPRSSTPRMISAYQRIGFPRVTACSQPGIARIGVMRPDSSTAGMVKRNPPRNACCWLAETVEMSSPAPSVVMRYSAVPR